MFWSKRFSLISNINNIVVGSVFDFVITRLKIGKFFELISMITKTVGSEFVYKLQNILLQ